MAKPVTDSRGHVKLPPRIVLARFYEWHMEHMCPHEHERIWLNASDGDKWAALCRVVPPRFRERCRAIEAHNVCWPHLHLMAEHLNSSAVHDAGRLSLGLASRHKNASGACVPWHTQLCETRSNKPFERNSAPPVLPVNRTDSGSVEGHLDAGLMHHHVVCSTAPQSEVALNLIGFE